MQVKSTKKTKQLNAQNLCKLQQDLEIIIRWAKYAVTTLKAMFNRKFRRQTCASSYKSCPLLIV